MARTELELQKIHDACPEFSIGDAIGGASTVPCVFCPAVAVVLPIKLEITIQRSTRKHNTLPFLRDDEVILLSLNAMGVHLFRVQKGESCAFCRAIRQ